MFCIHCGRPLPQNDSYCVCGGLQPGQKPPVQPEPAPMPEPVAEPAPTPEPVAEPAPMPEPVAEPVPVPEPVAEPAPMPEPVAEPAPMPEPAAEPAPTPEPVVEPVPMPKPVEAPVQNVVDRTIPSPQMPAGYPQTQAYMPQNPYPQQPVYPQQNAYAQPYPYPQQPVPGVYPHNPYAPSASGPYMPAVQPSPEVHRALKVLAGSPLFLVGTILVSLSFVLSLISCFLPKDLMHVISMLPGELSFVFTTPQVQQELYAYQQNAILTTVLSALPNLIMAALTVTGLWMIFASGKSSKSPTLKTSGLTILKVLQIIGLVGYALLTLLLVVFLVIMLVASAAASSAGGFSGDVAGTALLIISLILFLALIFVILMIVYCAKLVGSISAVKMAAETGVFSKKASMFVAVMNFIMAAFLLLDVYGVFVFSGWIALLTSVCGAGAYIVFGICIIQFNKKVQMLSKQL